MRGKLRPSIRTIIHLSDLHFGNTFDSLLEPLLEAVQRLAPHLVVVSGDSVERATIQEFEQARDYLSRMPQPQLIVPGNHDLPFYDLMRRYREGLSHYRRYISDDLGPVYEDSEMLVVGLNTARKFPVKGGRISAIQVDRVRALTCGKPQQMVKVLVTHHPLDLPQRFRKGSLARLARSAVETLSPCVDLMLAGHLHLSSSGATAARYGSTGHSVIFAQAGSAVSRRNKGEQNSFNLIQIGADQIEIQHHTWQPGPMAFEAGPGERFEHGPKGWQKLVGAGHSQQVQL